MNLLENNIIVVTGDYGSGKTEFALQYAKKLADKKGKATIADLDVINVYYRSRENLEQLKANNIEVIGGNLMDADGSDLPAVNYGFTSYINNVDSDLIIDLAGSKNGLKLITASTIEFKNFEMLMVLNVFRPDTDSSEKCINLIKQFQNFSGLKITGLVNNSNLLSYTTKEDIEYGQKIIEQVSQHVNIPIIYTMMPQNIDQLEINNDILAFDHLLNRQSYL